MIPAISAPLVLLERSDLLVHKVSRGPSARRVLKGLKGTPAPRERQDPRETLAQPGRPVIPDRKVRLGQPGLPVPKDLKVISAIPGRLAPLVRRARSGRLDYKVRKGTPATSDRKVLPVLLAPRDLRVRLARRVPKGLKAIPGRLDPPDRPAPLRGS